MPLCAEPPFPLHPAARSETQTHTQTGTHRDRVLPLELLKAVYQDRETSPHSPNNKTVRKETFRSLISGAPGACPHREGGGEGPRDGGREGGAGRERD